MYKVFFGNRYIAFSSEKENQLNPLNQSVFYCKNKKSFDKAYNKFIKDDKISQMDITSLKINSLFKHFTKKFKIIIAAGGLVENKSGETLVMKRKGTWDLPKGKLEKREKKRNAAVREVEEECGLKELSIEYKIGKSFHTYLEKRTSVLKITHWYKMVYKGESSAKPQSEEGITEIKWINKKEIPHYIELVYPNLRSVLETQLDH